MKKLGLAFLITAVFLTIFLSLTYAVIWVMMTFSPIVSILLGMFVMTFLVVYFLLIADGA